MFFYYIVEEEYDILLEKFGKIEAALENLNFSNTPKQLYTNVLELEEQSMQLQLKLDSLELSATLRGKKKELTSKIQNRLSQLDLLKRTIKEQ